MHPSPAEVARRWFEEVWNRQNPDVIYELMAPGAPGHMMHGTIYGPEPFHEAWKNFTGLMPGIRVVIEDIVEQGENAVVRWRMTGRHEGRALGLEPSDAEVRQHGITWFRIRDGKLVEGWDGWNEGGLLSQLQAASAAKLAALAQPA